MSACASTHTDTARSWDPDGGPALGSDRHAIRTPAWAAMPLSWNKLGAIENWLQSPGASRSSYWWIEGQLALGEGRLEFAADDLRDAGSGDPLRERLDASQRGLTLVKENPRASELQRTRAARGLASIDRLRGNLGATRKSVGIVDRRQWRARAERRGEMTPSGNRYTRITVHHSADSITPRLDGSLESSASAIRRIQKVHMDGPRTGYGDIGYHFLIDPDGRLFEGRELSWQGAHAKGANNQQNIGICLLGNFEEGRPTAAALRTLESTLGDLRRRYGISRSAVHGHLDFRNTLCPGEHLMSWVRSYSGRSR